MSSYQKVFLRNISNNHNSVKRKNKWGNFQYKLYFSIFHQYPSHVASAVLNDKINLFALRVSIPKISHFKEGSASWREWYIMSYDFYSFWVESSIETFPRKEVDKNSGEAEHEKASDQQDFGALLTQIYLYFPIILLFATLRFLWRKMNQEKSKLNVWQKRGNKEDFTILSTQTFNFFSWNISNGLLRTLDVNVQNISVTYYAKSLEENTK